MHWDTIHPEPGIKKNVKPSPDKHHESTDRRKLKLEDAVYLWNISAAVVMKQPINFSLSVLQAAVCDSGVPRKVLPLYESWSGGASVWHCVQAETSCGTRDQNPCPTGAVLLEMSLLKTINVSKLRGLKRRGSVCYLVKECLVSHERIWWLSLDLIYLKVEDKYYLCWFEQHLIITSAPLLHKMSQRKPHLAFVSRLCSDCPHWNVLWRLSSLLLRRRGRPWAHSGERLHLCLRDTRAIQTGADPLQARRYNTLFISQKSL